jgi:hypothetical protein
VDKQKFYSNELPIGTLGSKTDDFFTDSSRKIGTTAFSILRNMEGSAKNE